MRKLLVLLVLLVFTLPAFTEEKIKPNENCIRLLEKGEFCIIYCIGGIKFVLTSGGSFFPLVKMVDGKETSILCDCNESI